MHAGSLPRIGTREKQEKPWMRRWPVPCTRFKIRMTFWRSGRKEKVAAEIRFDAPLEPGDYGRLGRVLLKMAEAVDEETT